MKELKTSNLYNRQESVDFLFLSYPLSLLLYVSCQELIRTFPLDYKFRKNIPIDTRPVNLNT